MPQHTEPELTLQSVANEASLIRIVARNRKLALGPVGEIKGHITSDRIGNLDDVVVGIQAHESPPAWKFWKREKPVRGRGIGTALLLAFEEVMRDHGIKEIHGNLCPETPDKLEWLIHWYEQRGYHFHSGESTEGFVPPNTQGLIIKQLS